jgi:DNA repair protein RadC
MIPDITRLAHYLQQNPHNHPSGYVTPSEADIAVTDNLRKAGNLLGIPLIDHIIFIAQSSKFASFQKKDAMEKGGDTHI